MSNYSNSVEICDASSNTCNDYGSSTNGICGDSSVYASQAICCTASESCENMDSLETYLYQPGSIRCDGYQSCNSIDSIIASNGGDFYFAGSYALSPGTVITSDGRSNVYCTAYFSCQYSKIIDLVDVYCTGYYSCYEIRLIANISNIYVYGYYGAYQTSLITNVEGNVYAAGNRAMENTKIKNVTGNVYATGPYAMNSAKIINVNGVIAQGYSVLSNSRIRGFIYVNVTGGSRQALDSAIIVSESPTGISTLNVNTSTSSNDDFEFYCNQTDSCYINCYSEYACSNMELYCYGNCYVSCDAANGIFCPTALAGDYYLEISDGNYVLTTSDADCHKSFECSGIAAYVSVALECYGYSSCINAGEVSFTGSNNYVYCHGSYSCSEAVEFNTENRIECYGLKSCSNVGLLDGGYIYCYGEQSCDGSGIQSTRITRCYGDRSCANAVITIPCCESWDEFQLIELYGNFAAANSIIYVESIGYGDNTDLDDSYEDYYEFTDTYFYFWGANSGYNSTIICGFGKRCIFVCSGANACNQLSWYCGDGDNYDINNDWCQAYVFCNEKASDAFEEYFEDLSDYEWLEDLARENLYYQLTSHTGDFCTNNDYSTIMTSQLSTYSNSAPVCRSNSSNTYKCNDYTECSSDISINAGTSNDAYVCCTASGSCQDVSDISITDSSSNSIIRCDGYQSCRDVSDISIDNNGDVYLAGYYSTQGVSINNVENVVCSGYYSCRLNTITRVDNVYCNGYLSCDRASISYINNNVYLIAYYAGGDYNGGAVVSYVSGNVYCGAKSACEESQIKNIGGGIYAYGDSALRIGIVNNATELIVRGYKAFFGGSASGVSKVDLSGIQVIEWGRIISNLNGGILDVKLNMTNNENVMFMICNSTDICNIECLSSTSCQYMALSCYGECNVYCDDNVGIACPYASDGTSYTILGNFTNEPTKQPSVEPTGQPTTMKPSMQPTEMPIDNGGNGNGNNGNGNNGNGNGNSGGSDATEEPTAKPTKEPTSNPVGNGGSNNNGNNNGNNNDMDWNLIIILSIICITVIVLAILIFNYLNSNRKYKEASARLVPTISENVEAVETVSPRSQLRSELAMASINDNNKKEVNNDNNGGINADGVGYVLPGTTNSGP